MFYDFLNLTDDTIQLPETEYGIKALKKNSQIVYIPIDSSNVLITGVTGYGKTVFTKQYVQGILNKNPDTYAIFFQIKPDDFTEQFLRPEDKIITFNSQICNEKNLFKWNMIKEIRSLPRDKWEEKLEEISSILFTDLLEDKRNITWANGSKEVFKDFLKVILYCYCNNPSNFEIINEMKNMNIIKLLEFLWKYPPNRSMLKDNFEYDFSKKDYRINRKGSDILFFLQYVIGQFGGSFMSKDGDDTIHDYMNGKYGSRLFILHDHQSRDSSKMFERYFLKDIINEKLSLASSYHKKMLLVLDEIDKIGYDFGLIEAATLGRQFQLQVIVSTQSLNSLYALSPDKHGKELTDASLSGFPVMVVFHPGDSYTIETYQKLFGKTIKQTLCMPFSRYDQPKIITEECFQVKDEDFANLAVGECYIKYQSFDPERVKIII